MNKPFPETAAEYLRQHKGMTPEQAARLDAETPPFKPETRPEYQTMVRKTKNGEPLREVPLPEVE